MPPRQPSRPEFVALMALSIALVALAIDAMLPAFPAIAAELSADAPNRVQLILSVFMLGMGLGTLVAGPLSDAMGRRQVLTGGMALYAVGAVLASWAPSLETLLVARAVQGLGASASRVVTTAMVRDLFEGREMARITSFIMTVFMLVPAVAPSFGQLILSVSGWRTIFLAFVVAALGAALWLNLRQPETLPPERRRPFSVRSLAAGVRQILADRRTVLFVVILGLGFGQMLALLSSIQQIYDQVFGQGANFPLWFMLTAVVSACGTILNARLVMRLGMRRLALGAFLGLALVSALTAAVTALVDLPQAAAFAVFFGWSVALFFSTGLTFGNVTALAMQPLGHLAGLGSSLLAALSTLVAVVIAVPVGLAFAGTPLPAMLAACLCSALALVLMTRTD